MEALLFQIFPPNQFEIIIVSDGKDEQSKSFVKEFATVQQQHTIRYFELDQKKGPAAARNKGWQNAAAELIAFTDDDCIPDTMWLSTLWELHKQQNTALAAYVGRTIVPVSKVPTDYEKNIAHLSEAEFITANCAVTKTALIGVGGLDEAFTMAWREDSDLQFRLILNDVPIVKNESAVVTHPVRQAQWGVSLKEEKKGVFNALLYKKYPRLYKQKIQPQPPWSYYIIILSFIVFIIGIITASKAITIMGFLIWFLSTILFILKRLRGTQKSLKHTSEMIVTSLVIPFLSVYYRIYGAIKYRTPLIP
jgi:GT2 family glycosyltransferase